MTPESEHWLTLERLFHEALERPVDKRAQFLETVCGPDVQLRIELERLLGADAVAHSRIERIVAGGAARVRDALTETPGAMIGPYRLIRALGQGGMGTVWLAAADDHAAAPVALKFVRAEVASPEMIRRFRSERQILANLRHVNIAQLVGGGTLPDGRPYFVMEYIEGEPIDDWCCNRGLQIAARLDLFLAACAAVRFAHEKGVIHRDLKPGNILVTRDGIPKLLDFGIAKILDPRDAFAINTAPGVRMMTPQYASPEQVRGQPVSAATDVYGLGVVLYQLLTECLPYRLEKHLPHLLADAILTQTPELPSAAVQTQSLRDTLAGELDGIAMMALHKEPERRYTSVSQFAAQLQRFRTERFPRN